MEDTAVGPIVYAAPCALPCGVPPAARGPAVPPVDTAGNGDVLPTRRLQTLAFELTVAEARERQRIAHVLHDDVGQLLAMAQFRLSELRHGLPDEAGQSAAFEELRQLLIQAARATRTATFELHSPVLQQLGLVAALQGLAQRLERGSNLRVHVATHDFPDAGTLGDAVLSVLLRIVRELSLNTRKHAGATRLWIELGRDGAGRPRIQVRDDGVGFDACAAARRFTPEGGFGLVSAEAQMNAIGGRLTLESTPGGGTLATLSLGPGPWPVPVPVSGPDPAPPRPPAHPTSLS